MTQDSRTTEALLARRALAVKATPGPWIKVTAHEGDFDDDSTFITTRSRKKKSKVEIAKLEFTDPYNGKPTEFSIEQRANAAHIAASDPATIMTDIDELLCLRAKVERLEKEADWLTLVLANAGCGVPLTEYIDQDINGMSPPAPEHWREAARKATAHAMTE